MCAVVLGPIALAGCGSGSGNGTSEDPALAVPATAVLYAGATVRPEGMLKSNALAAGKALTHQADPYERLLTILQTPGSPPLDFNSDVAPWLGPHAGMFLNSTQGAGAIAPLLEQGLLGGSSAAAFPFARGGAQGAIVLDTTDSSKAQSFLHTQAQRAGAQPVSFRGVSYEQSPTGVAFMLVHRFAVIGSAAAARSVVLALQSGATLARSNGYSKLLDTAPSGALAHLYANAQAAAAMRHAEGLAAVAGQLTGVQAANASLIPEPKSVSVDIDLARSSSTSARGPLAYDPEAAQALEELPGESWLAAGLGHLGTQVGTDLAAIQAVVSLLGSGNGESTALSLGPLLHGLLAPLRVLAAGTPQARSQFASWMGPAGIFASGSNLLELKAAVVIVSTNPSLSRTAVSRLGEALHRQGATVSPASIPGTEAALNVGVAGLPVKLAIASGRASNGQSKFVIGLGEASVPAALHPSSLMSGAPARADAASSLGEGIEPSVIVNVPALLGLLEGVGLLEQPPVSQVLPYLRNLTTVTAGTRRLSDDQERFRLVLGL